MGSQGLQAELVDAGFPFLLCVLVESSLRKTTCTFFWREVNVNVVRRRSSAC